MSTTPGVINPTTIGRIGTPRDAAIAEANNRAASQTMANNAMAAGGRHKRLRGGAGEIPVAQFNLPYKDQSGPGTGVNSQVVANNKTSTQGAAFAVDDSLGAKMNGGFRKRLSHRKRSRSSKIGGNPNWAWGCYSGGKTRRKNRKSRKNRRKSRK